MTLSWKALACYQGHEVALYGFECFSYVDWLIYFFNLVQHSIGNHQLFTKPSAPSTFLLPVQVPWKPEVAAACLLFHSLGCSRTSSFQQLSSEEQTWAQRHNMRTVVICCHDASVNLTTADKQFLNRTFQFIIVFSICFFSVSAYMQNIWEMLPQWFSLLIQPLTLISCWEW